MRETFSSKTVITNPNELFGREDTLSQLIALANNGNSVAIIGNRRFGKTSVIKCVENIVLNNIESKVYPIYFDFKEVGSIIKGTDNVYRYMVSILVSVLSERNIFSDKLEIKKTLIKSSKDWEDVFESLEHVSSVRIQGVFEEIIQFFSEYLEKKILFLIDEYEWLFRFSFDEPVGFMKLRNFSTKPGPNGISPFTFWIAGSMSWEKLCSITGSPELNVIDAPTMVIGNIDSKSFSKMWDFELSKLINYSVVFKEINTIYDFVGGVPFFGKLIGSHILSSGTLPTYTVLKPHLEELYGSLISEERLIVNYLAILPRNLKKSIHLHNLLERGIIFYKEKVYDLNSIFLKDFVRSVILASSSSSQEDEAESSVLAREIEEIILSINQTNHNKKGEYVFVPVIDDFALMKDLKTPCKSIELFSDFASSIYKIIFERTKEGDTLLKRLPRLYKRGHQFIDIIDIMRHSLGRGHIMGNFSHRHGQMSKGEMLELLTGSRNEPNTSEDYYKLQISTLNLFKTELNNINTIIRN